MSFRKVTLFFLIAFFCQLTLINIISVKGFAPNLIMCTVVIITFLYEDGFRSIPFGIVFALLLDICAATYMGISSILMLIVGIFAETARIWLNVEKLSTLMTTGAIATIIYECGYWIFMRLLGSSMKLSYVLAQSMIFIVYNVLIMSIMFLVMHKKAERYHNDRYSI